VDSCIECDLNYFSGSRILDFGDTDSLATKFVLTFDPNSPDMVDATGNTV